MKSALSLLQGVDMFKHHLTYQLALGFDRNTRVALIDPAVRENLIQSSEKMLDHLARSFSTLDPVEESKNIVVALMCLRDCHNILVKAGLEVSNLKSKYEMLERRLETLCLKVLQPETPSRFSRHSSRMAR